MIRASREARAAVIAAGIAMLACAAPASAGTLSGDAATKALNAAGVGKTMLNGTRMVRSQDSTVRVTKLANGAKRLRYEVGPFTVIPGQNEIGFAPITEKPKVNGWITRIRPDLVYLNGKVPRVDVIHLHHGVWLNLSRPDATAGLPERFFAAGEEKTIMTFPKPFGYRYEASDGWLLNHMIHNLTPVASKVKLVYEIDFIPDGTQGRPGHARGATDLDGRARTAASIRSSTCTRAPASGTATPTRPTTRRRTRPRAVARTSGPRIATACSWPPRGTCTRAAPTRTCGSTARARRCARPSAEGRAARRPPAACKAKAPRGRGSKVHLFTLRPPSTSSRPAPCRGTWR